MSFPTLQVKKTSLPPQINTVSTQLADELIHYDFASQGVKDFSSLLAVCILFLNIFYSFEL